MADVAIAKPTTYAAMATSETPLTGPPPPNDASAAPPSAPPATSDTASAGHNGPQLPDFITHPIESVLGTLGRLATGVTSLVGDRGMRAIHTSRARPWLEFFDLSAFKLERASFSAYFERLRLNVPYFLFNYIIVGLAMTVFSVITKPLSLIGAAVLIWTYFQFFGAETAEDDFRLFGFSLDTHEKIGCLVILGVAVFWITAGGLQVFFSVLSASIFVAVIHGIFRKPTAAVQPPSTEEAQV